MKKFVFLFLIWISISSCSEKKKVENFNPEAIQLNSQAVELIKMYNVDSAMILLDKAIKVDINYYYSHTNKATIYVIQKKYDKAIEEGDLVVEMNPEFAEAWVFAGMLYDRVDKSDKANKYYQKSIEIFDERITKLKDKVQINLFRLNKAISLILLGKENEGKQELMKLKTDDPENFMIDEIMKLNKEEYLNQILGKK